MDKVHLTKKQRAICMAHWTKHPNLSLVQDRAWMKHAIHVEMSLDQVSDLFQEGLETQEIEAEGF